MTTWSLTGHQSLLSILGRGLKASRLAPLALVAAGVSCLVPEWAVKR